MISLQPLTINGKIIPVGLNDNTGTFQATLDGVTHQQHTCSDSFLVQETVLHEKVVKPVDTCEFESSDSRTSNYVIVRSPSSVEITSLWNVVQEQQEL